MPEEIKNRDSKIEPTLTEERIKELTTLQVYAKKVAIKDFFTVMMSPTVKEIAKAITEFHSILPPLTTNKKTTSGVIYKYQDMPAFLKGITHSLSKCGLSACQGIQAIPSKVDDKDYIVTIILHHSGEYIRSVTGLPKRDQQKNLAKTLGDCTQIKRHALKSLLGIDADDDTDGGATYTQKSNY